MRNKVFELVSVIIGAFIGAGFVSGREVAEYFAKYGFVAIFFSFALIFLFYFFVKMCLNIGRKYNYSDNILQLVFKSKYRIVEVLIIIASVINIGAMIAGCYTIGEVLGSNALKIILPLVSIILCYFVNIRKYFGVSLINKLVVPILLILILVITVITITNSTTVTLITDNILLSFLGGATSSIIYILFNMLLIGVLLIQIGGKYSHREINISSKISSIIIGLLIMLVSLSITLSDISVISSDMPLLLECLNINKNFALVFAVSQFLGIFTTLISSTFLVANVFNRKVRSYSICIILSLVLGLLISFIGFYNIVNYLYKFTGFLSAIFFLLLINVKLSKHERKNINYYKK